MTDHRADALRTVIDEARWHDWGSKEPENFNVARRLWTAANALLDVGDQHRPPATEAPADDALVERLAKKVRDLQNPAHDWELYRIIARAVIPIAQAPLLAQLAACAPYLKPGQTPAERMAQDQIDLLNAMGLWETATFNYQQTLAQLAERDATIQLIQGIAEGSTTANSLQHIAKIARAALTSPSTASPDPQA